MKNSKKLFLLFFVTLSIFFVTCTVDTRDIRDTRDSRQDAQHAQAVDNCCIMTVFIHGTVGPHFSFKAIGGWFASLFKKKPRKISAFQQYVEQVKRYGFHRLQPINELGFFPIDLSIKLEKSNIAYIGQQTAILYQKVYDNVHPDHKNKIAFYTFNWTGRLHKRSRRQAAMELYREIYDEAQRLHEQTRKPIKIWLLGHSHGANVILNLEEEEAAQKKNLVIDKAIFFGGPVQTETELFVQGKIFKNIYNIYSKGDHFQRLDFVSTQDWFSRQTFGSHKKKPIDLPKNLNQVEVEIGSCKPFHYELWLWGRKRFPHFFYRKRLCLHPLPLSIFTPLIISMVDELEMPEDKTDLYHLKIDGKKGTFDLRGAGLQKEQVIDVTALRGEGLAAL